MISKQTIADYVYGCRLAAGHEALRMPGQALRMALARSVYGVGPRTYTLFDLHETPIASWSDFVLDEDRFKDDVLKRVNPPDAWQLAEDKLVFWRTSCFIYRDRDPRERLTRG